MAPAAALFALALAGSALAYPGRVLDPRATAYPWIAASPTDARSPCPGLNSLANHGILPRNGRGITLPILTAALQTGYNVGPDFSIAIGGFGLDTTPTPRDFFDLDNLSKHGVIEHDGSLSRQDFHLGNNTVFNQTLFIVILNSVPAGQTRFSFASAAAGRWARMSADHANDPQFVYTPKEVVLSYGETALYLSVLGNPITGEAPVAYVREWFQKERLPYALGWSPSPIVTDLTTLGVMVGSLQLASPQAALLAEDFVITSSTLKAVLSGAEVGPLIPCGLGGSGCVGSKV